MFWEDNAKAQTASVNNSISEIRGGPEQSSLLSWPQIFPLDHLQSFWCILTNESDRVRGMSYTFMKKGHSNLL